MFPSATVTVMQVKYYSFDLEKREKLITGKDADKRGLLPIPDVCEDCLCLGENHLTVPTKNM